MSPIDDELRNLLSSRAADVPPSPDPLSGIEARARRLRRNRAIASVAAGVVAVTAVALAVPTLVTDRHDADQVTTSTAPSLSASVDAYALDPAHPWAYRGDPSVVRPNELASLQAEWAAKHLGTTVSPLFGQIYEPSGKPEVVFVAGDRWGMATSSEAGWTFPVDEPLGRGTRVLMAPLPGDEVPRLLILTSPQAGQISYAANGSDFRDLIGPDSGVAFAPLEGDTSRDVVRVLDANGYRDAPIFQGAAPDMSTMTPSPAPAASPTPGQPAETTSAPTLAAKYAFDPAKPWPYRGSTQDGLGDIVSADHKAFMTTYPQVPGEQVTTLYAAHVSSTTDLAVVLHARSDGNWVSFTAHQGTTTKQVVYRPTPGEDILSAYVPLTDSVGLLVAVVSDQAAGVVLQTGARSEVGGSRTVGVWDWTSNADPQARLAAFAPGDAEPYSSQPAL